MNDINEPDKLNPETVSLRLYHGIGRIVGINDIVFPGPRQNCDFGNGFYLTKNEGIAEEWVKDEAKPYINAYTLNKIRGKDSRKIRVTLCRNALAPATAFHSPRKSELCHAPLFTFFMR